MLPTLSSVDYAIIIVYVVFAVALGGFFFKAASKSVESFFVGDRKLPWYVAGTSIVATTFAADTPLAVTGLVAAGGISNNWIWWSWAVAHIVATFYFAKLWRRSGVITDAEFVEVRYSGKAAAALRGFKAVYFGVFINCMTMAWVIAAMVKIAQAFFVVDASVVIILCIVVSVLYTTLGGFRGVVITDMVQFCLGMGGATILAILTLEKYGGIGELSTEEQGGSGLMHALEGVVENQVIDTVPALVEFIPPTDHPSLPLVYFIILLLVGWWRLAEGSGYIVQRLAACKDEAHAQAASLWFAVAHNALRPWPWIIVGLAALVMYPNFKTSTGSLDAGLGWQNNIFVSPSFIDSHQKSTLKFSLDPRVFSTDSPQSNAAARLDGCRVEFSEQKLGVIEGSTLVVPALGISARADLSVHCGDRPAVIVPNMVSKLKDREMAYPLVMGEVLPSGLLGLLIASLLAAFMSTIDTHTNWGASYLVRDLYRRFWVKDREEEHYVWVSRAAIILMAILAGLFALVIQSIASVWVFLITIGAGLGSVSAARWFWRRVTPHAEFAAMFITTVVALGLEVGFSEQLFGGPNPLFLGATIFAWQKILIVALASLVTWIPVALLGPQNDEATLKRYAQQVRPMGHSFGRYLDTPTVSMWSPFAKVMLGVFIVYGALFGVGLMLFGHLLWGLVFCTGVVLALFGLSRKNRKRKNRPPALNT